MVMVVRFAASVNRRGVIPVVVEIDMHLKLMKNEWQSSCKNRDLSVWASEPGCSWATVICDILHTVAGRLRSCFQDLQRPWRLDENRG
jgi:hypothetical protein